ncbi:hypothetical protein F5X99DRAFT_420261 [Biscogniauxia marginata]|nr:hypothetical protein F5X99DRAFT_420261 [Biscogniauxia marginata]
MSGCDAEAHQSDVGGPIDIYSLDLREKNALLVQSHGDECRLCNLLSRAVQRYSHDRAQPTTQLFITWEVNGRKLTPEDWVVNRNRRIHLSWLENDGEEENVYLIFVAPRDRTNDSSGAPTGVANGALNLMKGWTCLCIKSHGNNCQIKHGTRDEFMKLVEAAGSSMWGQVPYTTTRSNVILHIQKDGLREALEKLPEIIRDAMLLVKQLGEVFMVHGSSTRWLCIYDFAHFTICAADGNTTTGLRAVKSILATGETRNSGPHPSMPFSEASEDMMGTPQPTKNDPYMPLTAECLPRLLPRRCLIFAEGQVYFQCHSAVMSQDIFNDEESSVWFFDWTNSLLRTLGELRSKAFWFYTKSILLRKPKESRRGKCTHDEYGNGTCDIPEGSYRKTEFTSWSSCGWSGGKAGYQVDVIDGCLIHVQEWLRHHTWILWYFRDYEGK